MAKTKKGGLSAGDLIRAPVGLAVIYVSIVLLIKAAGVFEWSPLPVIVSVMGVLISLLFLALGIVMSARPFAQSVGKPKSSAAPGEKKTGIAGKISRGAKSSYPKLLTSSQAVEAARAALVDKYPEHGETARMCCVYTSVLDCKTVVGEGGVSGGWHVDFYLPLQKRVVLVRVARGRAKIMEKDWEATRQSPVEYVFAGYGIGLVPEPLELPASPADSPEIDRITLEALFPSVDPDLEEYYAPVMVCFPAHYLRYLQDEKTRAALGFPEPPSGSAAVICSSEDLYEEDSFLFYINPETGKILLSHTFRYPDLFTFGNSVDW